ncbi:nuclear transport factor 2 family protein [Streptomyces spinosirectus]|jgi:ketosteroid isomerase-like protein|uniref:nuclear transport factor 2 family protein n=2 Tax=Streptomyces TaxID=1883 RepID=UPI000FFF5E28|nr:MULTISPECIES: nuclear transport factor 2 family protein [Streptomyces]MBY8341912.1 nuclear transport factor 2 family protein [Streptomyces plumbidurans]UIR16739.1 nuclear transport factor 2 family protein [Streptomyces spinosirectus]
MSHLDAPRTRTPHEVLTCYYQAMLDKSPDDLADLYAVDAVHEFPFTSPGFPSCFEGREAVRAGYRAAWGASPAEVQEVRRVAAYETVDPGLIVAEHVVVGTLPAEATTFTVPGLLILHVRDGLITRARDYMDASGVAAARA